MKLLFLFAFLFALALGAPNPHYPNPPIYPCDVSLEEIKIATEYAYIARAQCERHNFMGDDCDAYWMKAAHVLELETNFRQCREQTIDEYFNFLVGTDWTNGEIAREAEITRDVIRHYAGKTEEKIEYAVREILNKIEDESQATRHKIVEEAKKTREALETALYELKGDLAHQFYALNHSLYNLIKYEGHETRELVAKEGYETRDLVKDESTKTRHEISEGLHHTDSIIQHGVEQIKDDIHDLQTSQNYFENLLVKILIEASFSADLDAGRIDLFQRPKRAGGYYEVVKAIVLEVVAFNEAHYHVNKHAIQNALEEAHNFESHGDFRKAWESLRRAYLLAVASYD